MAAQLGELLKEIGLIDDMQLMSALGHQKKWGGRIGEIMVEQGFLDEMGLYETLARHFSIQLVSIPMLPISQEAMSVVPVQLAQKHTIFPLKLTERAIAIAVEDPRNMAAVDEVAFHARKRVHTVLAPQREIEWAIRAYYFGENVPCPPPKVRLHLPSGIDDPTGAMEIMDRRARVLPDDPLLLHAKPTPSQEGAPVGGAPAGPPPATFDDVARLAAAVEGLQIAVRFLLDAGIARGSFTRDEYLRYVSEAQGQLPPH